MYKTLCVAVFLLCPTFILAQKGKPTTSPFTSPLIVAKGKLVNQTAPIPTTTIFTPPQDGLYRLSVYATLVQNAYNSQSSWSYTLGWTDDAGQEYVGALLYSYDSSLGQFNYQNFFPQGGAAVPFEAKAGMPITYGVAQLGPADGTVYSLYWTLERLE